MAMNKIKKGDTVKVIAGKDKGKEGKVIKVEDGKVLVEGVAVVTKHTKASQQNPQGGIVKQLNNELFQPFSIVLWLVLSFLLL